VEQRRGIFISAGLCPGPALPGCPLPRPAATDGPEPMSLSHCPLCVALAVISTLRGFSLALQVWQLSFSVPVP